MLVDPQPDEHGEHRDRPTVERPAEQGTRPRVGAPAGRDARRQRRSGLGRMSSSVSAITSPATPSSSSVWLRSSRAPASTTTGAPGDDVAAVAELEARVLDRLLEEPDRLMPLGVGQIGAEAHDDLGGVPVGKR